VDTSYAFACKSVGQTNLDFYHVAEATRVGEGEGQAAYGTVLQLCNAVGLLDFTGFISGNIARGEKLKAAVASPEWTTYGKSSYPQSLGVLETMANAPAMLIELGVVQTGKPDEKLGPQWAAQDTCWRYVYIADGLKKLVERGMIPPKVHETFFRYLEGSLIHRLVDQFNGRASLVPGTVSLSDWDSLIYLVQMVEGERGEALSDWVKNIRDVLIEETPVFEAFVKSWDKVKQVANGMSMPLYPLSYLIQEK